MFRQKILWQAGLPQAYPKRNFLLENKTDPAFVLAPGGNHFRKKKEPLFRGLIKGKLHIAGHHLDDLPVRFPHTFPPQAGDIVDGILHTRSHKTIAAIKLLAL